MAAIASSPDEISRVPVLELKACGCVSLEEAQEATDKPRRILKYVRRNINNVSHRHVSRYIYTPIVSVIGYHQDDTDNLFATLPDLFSIFSLVFYQVFKQFIIIIISIVYYYNYFSYLFT